MTTTSQLRIVLNFLAILFASLSADAAEVKLRPTAHAQGSVVLLGDVADVQAADADISAKLVRIELFPAPADGKSKLLHVRELVELLVLHDIDLNQVEFAGAKTTRIYPRQAPAVVATSVALPIVTREAMVVVAARGLNRGDVIRESDLELKVPSSVPRGAVTAVEPREVVGQEVLRSIAAGEIVDQRQLRKPLLVRRGELVRVKARAAGVQVVTTAKALSEGSFGDIINVQSLENRQQYSTYVTGLHQVEVYATGISASDTTNRINQRPARTTEHSSYAQDE